MQRLPLRHLSALTPQSLRRAAAHTRSPPPSWASRGAASVALGPKAQWALIRTPGWRWLLVGRALALLIHLAQKFKEAAGASQPQHAFRAGRCWTLPSPAHLSTPTHFAPTLQLAPCTYHPLLLPSSAGRLACLATRPRTPWPPSTYGSNLEWLPGGAARTSLVRCPGCCLGRSRSCRPTGEQNGAELLHHSRCVRRALCSSLCSSWAVASSW